jgi:hypothetical protein
MGVWKLRDFYDPFDILMSDSMLIAGVALWLYARGRLGRHGGPPATSGVQLASAMTGAKPAGEPGQS